MPVGGGGVVNLFTGVGATADLAFCASISSSVSVRGGVGGGGVGHHFTPTTSVVV